MKLYKALCAPGTYVAKKLAAYNPGIRQLIINMAQGKHQRVEKLEMRLKDYTTGTKSTDPIEPLPQEKALQIGADIVGEGGVAMMALAASGVGWWLSNRVFLLREKEFARNMESLEREIMLAKLLLSSDRSIDAGKTSAGKSNL